MKLKVYRAGIDGYYDEIWQKQSAEIFESHGYELVIKNVANMGNPYEDWWVDPKVVDRAIIDKFSKLIVGLENPRNVFSVIHNFL